MLSKKAKYGLKALIYLAERVEKGPVGIQEIADSQQIPKKFLDAILLELRNIGLLQSRKGKGGGYTLARPADDIPIGAIIRALDGPLAPIRCASRTAYQPCTDCIDIPTCRIRRIMIDVREAMAEILDEKCLSDLTARSPNYVPDFVI